MPRVLAEATAQIDAPIEVVWRVMTDLAAYPEWNPFVVSIDAKEAPRLGSRMKLHVRWSDGGTATSDEEVTQLDQPSGGRATFAYRFTGPLDALGLVKAVRVQALEQSAGGPTIYTTREEFGGLLTRFLPLAKVQDGFERHARALKARAESLAR
jgi:hypothetical protein